MTTATENVTFNEEQRASMQRIESMVRNQLSTRSQLMKAFLDPRRDIAQECGYPEVIEIDDYKEMHSREGICSRVVSLYPDECWVNDPQIMESDEKEKTAFDKAWDNLEVKHNLFHYMHRIDVMSGIGHYGVLLLGLSDGKPLEEPVEGVNEDGTFNENVSQLELLYVRAFDEGLAPVDSYNRDETSPRFGQPEYYNITFHDPNLYTGQIAEPAGRQLKVHWSRCVHIADNRTSSEVHGVPRQKPVFNYLLNLRKLLGGSAEMFWKGAFPGYSFEVNPDLTDVEIDTSTLRDEFWNYAQGLQRYLALEGVTAKSLSPQVADPQGHIDSQLQGIAITLKCPMRIFMGSEAAHLASSQDKETWNGRLKNRREKYLTPWVIRPVIDRLIALGILPRPAGGTMEEDSGEVQGESYLVVWEDLNKQTDEEKATVAGLLVKAIAQYIQSGAQTLVPPKEFLTLFLGLDEDVADAILEAAEELIEEIDEMALEEEMEMEDDVRSGDDDESDDDEEPTKSGSDKDEQSGPPVSRGNKTPPLRPKSSRT